MDGGNRFTPYAIPVLGLGLGFLGVLLSSYLFERIAEFGFTQRLLALKIDKIVPIVLVLAATVPSAYLLADYKPKPDLQKPEIAALRAFRNPREKSKITKTIAKCCGRSHAQAHFIAD